jgi:hypothetical protein
MTSYTQLLRGWSQRFPKTYQLRPVCTVFWFVLAIVLLFPSSSTKSRRFQRSIVFAIYYPTFKAGDWKNDSFFETPALGRYGTDIASTAVTHIAWAHQNRIDGFLLSWGGQGSQSDEHLKGGILAAQTVTNIKLMILYESLDRLGDSPKSENDIDFRSPYVYQTLVEDLRAMKEYFGHPSYFNVNGKPVVVLRSSRKFRRFGRGILSAIRRDLKINIFFVGDECYPVGNQSSPETARNVWKNGEPVFDAYSAMSMHEDESVIVGESALEYHKRVSLPAFSTWASAVPFFPLLTPKYNVYGLKTLPGTAGDFWTQIRGTQSLNFKPISDAIGAVYVIRSFNQWFEGSSIEPAKEFGYDYLNVVSAAFTNGE